jgi:hypothetical protein
MLVTPSTVVKSAVSRRDRHAEQWQIELGDTVGCDARGALPRPVFRLPFSTCLAVGREWNQIGRQGSRRRQRRREDRSGPFASPVAAGTFGSGRVILGAISHRR